MSNKSPFLLILLGSFLISSILWFGIIDQDFFHFYYMGHGIANGQGMFTDFIDNKGPVFYTFFTLFYLVFKENYSIGLVLTSTFIDAFSLSLIFKILTRDWGFKWFKKQIINILVVVFCLLLFKSFSIGTYVGGFYSENLGMLLLLLSIWFLGKRNSLISGILFSLCVLTKLTFLFFAPYLLIELYFKFKNPKQFLGFFLGGLMPFGIFTIWFWATNQLNDFIYNVFILNLNYAKTPVFSQIRLILLRSVFEFRIFITVVFSLLIILLEFFSKEQKSKKIILLTLLISTLLATFVGKTFFFHHFLQYTLIAFISLTFFTNLSKFKVVFTPLLFFLALSLVFNFFFYLELSKNSIFLLNYTPPDITEVNNKNYMVVMPYYPIYYIKYKKTSPDRYFSYFFLSKYRYNNSQIEIEKHKKLDKNKLAATIFLFVKRNEGDRILINEYKENFGNEFRLTKVGVYKDSESIIEVYESK